MPAPLIGLAVGVAARLAAKKAAQEAAKKVAKKTITKAATKAAKANARGLKAANKPTKAAKTGIGNNEKISVEVRRGALKNEPPARANRTRGGGMATLKRQQAQAREATKNKGFEIEIQGKMYKTGGPAEKKMARLRKLQSGNQ